MFMRLAEELTRIGDNPPTWPEAANRVFRYRPIELLNHLELYWIANQGENGRDLGANELMRQNLGFNIPTDPIILDPTTLPDPEHTGEYLCPIWPHLIYAYSIENTRIIAVFQRVLREMLTGERLGRPNETVLSWLRTTEELFYTDRLGRWIFSPVSRLRDDATAIRRNAYYRMFGMDLNHGTDDGRSYPYPRPEVANRGFVQAFEQLLRETWRAYSNRNNQIGQNTTDRASLLDLVYRLRDMLRDRRIYGSLAREEFYSVATLSWFHLTVSADNEVVTFLQAQGNNWAERLRAIGERVALPAHSRSYNYFSMANELSQILITIENNYFNEDNIETLYNDTDETSQQMLTIINHWSAATGRNLKEPGLYLPETSFAMSRLLVQQGGNGYHSLAKVK